MNVNFDAEEAVEMPEETVEYLEGFRDYLLGQLVDMFSDRFHGEEVEDSELLELAEMAAFTQFDITERKER